ncbi:MAG: hypothetical protein QW618_04435 [Nitrososphaerales archaeon]
MMQANVYEATLQVLSKDTTGEMKRLLHDIVEWEKNNHGKCLGFEWYSVSGDPRTLNALVVKKILKIVLKTNKSAFYVASDVEAIEKALKDYENLFKPVVEVEIPNDIFDIIIGHDDKKELLKRIIFSNHRIHALLHGSVASAKSLFLEELSRLPNSRFVLGSRLSGPGLYEILFTERPSYLLIDELDKVSELDTLACLLSVMETGRVVEAKYGKERSIVLNLKVFAAANRVDKIWPELLSRFLLLKFRDYTDDEYINVVTRVLMIREGLEQWLAQRIAHEMVRLKSHDVRDAIRVARLLKEHTLDDLNRVIELIKKQN